MCTLIAAWQVFADVPLAVVANRDEARDRPFEAPRCRSWERPVVAPKDCRAGGTWMGYNDAGVFAGLTNRWRQPTASTTHSRGHLVKTALGAGRTADAVTRVIDALEDAAYGPCHLFVADSTTARLVIHDGPETVPTVHTVTPGVHVVLNAGFDDQWFLPAEHAERASEQRRLAAKIRAHCTPATNLPEWRSRAVEAVSEEQFGRCLCGETFGTRSSSVVVMDDEPTWEFANGPPCETAYQPVAATVPRQ